MSDAPERRSALEESEIENPCKELWYKNKIKDLEAKLEKAYANLDKLDPSGVFRSYDDD